MDAIYRFDYSILNYINENMHTPFFDKFFAIITHLADAGWFWIALAVVLLCFKRTRKTGLVMGGALVLGLIFGNGILKPLINRIRPYDNAAWDPIVTRATLLIKPPHDASFPSGHTAASFAAMLALNRHSCWRCLSHSQDCISSFTTPQTCSADSCSASDLPSCPSA